MAEKNQEREKAAKENGEEMLKMVSEIPING